MQHKILVGWSKQQAEEFAEELQLTVTSLDNRELEVVRVIVNQFWQFSFEKSVLLVNTSVYDERRFGFFLKMLEDENLPGVVWFYGGVLSKYPFTMRSRCEVYPSPTFSRQAEFWRDWCKESGKAGYYPAILELRHYAHDEAMLLMDKKDRFVDLLYGLEIAMNFNIYQSQLEEVSWVFIHLFLEWLNKNPIFSEKQLGLCPFLREKRFSQMYGDLVNWHFPDDKEAETLFLFMFAYKAISV